MGYLLKEALKTLCGVNHWSYAVFWKIGCQNPKLLIWEECYYESELYSCRIQEVGSSKLAFNDWGAFWDSDEVLNSQPVQAGEAVRLLINKMMMQNQFNLVGEGLVGRAAVTGYHQWILSQGNSREAYPLEVLKELSQQFSAGIETIAVIPVLPHGVVQLGSYKPIMENMGFVNDVKMAICQLGCIPGVLLSNEDAMREPAQNIGVPIHLGNSISEDFVGRSDVLDSVPIAFRKSETNMVQSEMHVGQTSSSFVGQNLGKLRPTGATFGATNNNNTHGFVEYHDDLGQSKGLPFMKSNFSPKDRPVYEVTNFSQPRRDADLVPSHLENSGLRSSDSKSAEFQLDGSKGMEENDLFQALGIFMPQHIENPSIPDFSYNDVKHEYGVQITTSPDDKYDNAFFQDQSGDDLFDILGADFKNKLLNGNWNDSQDSGIKNTSKDASSTVNQGKSDPDTFPVSSFDHLLDSLASIPSVKQSLDDNVSCRTTLTNMSSSSRVLMPTEMQGELIGLHRSLADSGVMGSCSFVSESSKDTAGSFLHSSSIYGSQISSWFEQGHDVKKSSSVSTAQSKKNDETSKTSRKRLKPGENPRPRPKDRQMIQDRLKELREIVPNGAKCSIDSLLERAIKHMLFLQSIAKHADKLKQIGELKIISTEGGLCLKDNFDGGATWAYEVGSQSMVCPIIIEDLNQPRQMLVKMLCEERGLFLEIADVIRGLGLTILIGVIETRNEKIWARFAVEANKDVTRMEIFVSLVRLLEQTANGAEASNNADEHETTKDKQSIATAGQQAPPRILQ